MHLITNHAMRDEPVLAALAKGFETAVRSRVQHALLSNINDR